MSEPLPSGESANNANGREFSTLIRENSRRLADQNPPFDLDRRYETHVTLLAGAIYIAAIGAIELAARDTPLRPTALAVYLLLSLALAARYLWWRRHPFDVPPGRLFPYLFAGFGLVAAIAGILQSHPSLFFYLTAVEGCLVFLRRRWRLVWLGSVMAMAWGIDLSFREGATAGLALLRDAPVYLLLMVAAELVLRQEAHRGQVERLFQELAAAHRQLQDYIAQAEALAVAEERTRWPGRSMTPWAIP